MTDLPRKKKNPFVLAAIALGVLFGLWILLRITNTLNYYRVTTTSCEPRYEVDDLIFTSGRIGFQKGDFVCYRDMSGELFTSQCIALAGDTLEVRASVAYVNGKLADDTTLLKFACILPPSASPKSVADTMEKAYFMQDSAGNRMTFLSAAGIKHMGGKRQVMQKAQASQGIWNGSANHWNQHWFGPYVVPEGYVFLLSPNRDNALDSRYRGPIRVDDIVSTNLN